jgi:hypothetical protein
MRARWAGWVNLDRRARAGDGPLSKCERDELTRLRKENTELAMERDVLKRSAALWGSRKRWGGEPGRADRRPEGRLRHARDRIRSITARSRLLVPVEQIVEELNLFLLSTAREN